MPFFIRLRRKWKLLAAGTALLAALIACQGKIQEQIDKVQEKKAAAVLKKTGLEQWLQNAKDLIEQANGLFEKTGEYKSRAERIEKKNGDALGAYQEALSNLDNAEKLLAGANIEDIGRSVSNFSAIAPSFIEPLWADELVSNSRRWLGILKKRYEKLKGAISEEKAEISQKIDTIKKRA